MKGAVSRIASDRPLTSISERKIKMAKQPTTTVVDITPHSAYGAERSRKYHSILDRFNPTKTPPARRSYPGIPN